MSDIDAEIAATETPERAEGLRALKELRDFVYGLIEEISSLRYENATLCKQLADARAGHASASAANEDLAMQLAEAHRALEGLTVGGSEFVGDPERCVRNIREQMDHLRRFKERAMERCREAEEKLSEALLKIGDLERTIEFVAEAKAEGKVITYYPTGVVAMEDFVTCPECGGQGWYVEGYDPPSQEPCPECGSMGKVPISQVKIREEERKEVGTDALTIATEWEAKRAWELHMFTCEQCSDQSARFCDDGFALLRRSSLRENRIRANEAAAAILRAEASHKERS